MTQMQRYRLFRLQFPHWWKIIAFEMAWKYRKDEALFEYIQEIWK